MNSAKILAGGAALAACLASTLASAQVADDVRMMLEKLKPMLEAAVPGESMAWQNPADGSSYRMTYVSASTRDGMACGTVDIAGAGRLGSNERKFTLCKQSDGRWGMAN